MVIYDMYMCICKYICINIFIYIVYVSISSDRMVERHEDYKTVRSSHELKTFHPVYADLAYHHSNANVQN